MIVSKNINPERDLYYLGGRVIEVLENLNKKEVDYIELYQNVNKQHNVSINLFSLTLDWLFIVGVIKKGKNGFLEKCF